MLYKIKTVDGKERVHESRHSLEEIMHVMQVSRFFVADGMVYNSANIISVEKME